MTRFRLALALPACLALAASQAPLHAALLDGARIVMDTTSSTVLNQTGTTADGLTNLTFQRFGLSTPTPITDLLDTAGNTTSISATISGDLTNIGGANNSSFQGFNNSGPTSLTGTAATLFPTDFAATFGFMQTLGEVGEITFANLPTNFTYSFDVYAGRAANGTREGIYRLLGATTTSGILNATSVVGSAGNTSDVLHLGPIAPDLNGQIKLQVEVNPGSAFSYLNAVQITANAVPEPASLALASLGSLLVLVRRHRH